MAEATLDTYQLKRVKSHNAAQMMALSMIKMGMERADIISTTGISHNQFNRLYHEFEQNNMDALSTEVIETWEMLLRAKLMNVSEKALDVVLDELEAGDTKSAKAASEVFNNIFNSFRLSTGKSTENISSASIRFNEIIESKRKLVQPGQEQEQVNVTTV